MSAKDSVPFKVSHLVILEAQCCTSQLKNAQMWVTDEKLQASDEENPHLSIVTNESGPHNYYHKFGEWLTGK